MFAKTNSYLLACGCASRLRVVEETKNEKKSKVLLKGEASQPKALRKIKQKIKLIKKSKSRKKISPPLGGDIGGGV